MEEFDLIRSVKEEEYTRKQQSKQRFVDKTYAADVKAYTRRGWKGKLPKGSDKITPQVISRVAAFAVQQRVRTGTQVANKKLRRFQVAEGFAPHRVLPHKPAASKVGRGQSDKKAPTPKAFDLYATVSRFKRTGQVDRAITHSLVSQAYDKYNADLAGGKAAKQIDGREYKRLLQILLQRGGVELNPGPGPPGERKMEKSVAHHGKADPKYQCRQPNQASRRIAAKKYDRKAATAALQKTVIDGLEKEAAKVDVAAEIAACPPTVEEPTPPTIEEVHDTIRVETGYRNVRECFDRVTFDYVIGADTYEPSVAGVMSELPLNPLPHRVVEARLHSVEEHFEQQAIPQNRYAKPNGKLYHTLVYHCELVNFGLVGIEVSRESFREEQRIPYEVLLRAMTMRSNRTGVFSTTLAQVIALRTSNLDFMCNGYAEGVDTMLSDRLFTALMLVGSLASNLPLPYDLLRAGATKLIATHIIPELTPTRPMETGWYVRGYETTFAETCVGSTTEALLDKHAGMVACGRRLTRDALELRANISTRLNTVCHIADFVPTFPNPFSRANCVIGAVKRLLCPLKPADEEDTARIKAVVDVIADHIEPSQDMDSTIHEAAAVVVAGMTWTEEERAQFMTGVSFALDTAPVVTDELEEVLRVFKGFIKRETYPQTAVKAVRYITCPSHFCRGLLFGLLSSGCYAVTQAVNKLGGRIHMVKGLTPEQFRDQLVAQCQSFHDFIESDYKSFERQVTSRLQKLGEARLIPLGVPLRLRLFAYAVMNHLATHQIEMQSFLNLIMLPIMRYSGTYHTSIGNMISNVAATFASISRAAKVPVDQVSDWFRTYAPPWFVEGDDALIAISDAQMLSTDFVADVDANHVLGGRKVTMEHVVKFFDGHFCGNRLMNDFHAGWLRLKEPLESLSRVFTVFGANADGSCKKDLSLLVAKARAYAKEFPGNPMLYEICGMIIMRFHAADGSLVQEVKSLIDSIAAGVQKTKLSAGAQEVLKRYSRAPEQLMEFVKPLVVVPVTACMREACRKAYGYTEAFQTAVVAEFKEGLGRLEREGQVHCPTLMTYWSKLDAVRRMTLTRIEGARSVAQAAAVSLDETATRVEGTRLGRAAAALLGLTTESTAHTLRKVARCCLFVADWFWPLVIFVVATLSTILLAGALIVGIPIGYFLFGFSPSKVAKVSRWAFWTVILFMVAWRLQRRGVFRTVARKAVSLYHSAHSRMARVSSTAEQTSIEEVDDCPAPGYPAPPPPSGQTTPKVSQDEVPAFRTRC